MFQNVLKILQREVPFQGQELSEKFRNKKISEIWKWLTKSMTFGKCLVMEAC